MSDTVTSTKSTAFVVPVTPSEPAKTGTAMVVHRPAPAAVAVRVQETIAALHDTVHDVSYGGYNRTPQVPTDSWPFPVVLGGMVAVGSLMAFGEVGLVSYLAMSVGAAASAVMGALHPSRKRAAIAALPSVLNNEKRTKLLALASARHDFEQGQGAAKLDAPAVDVALAKHAKIWLDRVRENGVHDPELEKILEGYANMATSVDKDDQALLDVIEKLSGTQCYYVSQAFAELPDDQKKALAPFMRAQHFTEDGPKGHGDYGHLMPLFEQLEAIDHATARSVEAHPKDVPAAVPTHVDATVMLGNVATFISKLHNRTETGFLDAQAFAIADERTGVERVLIGTIAERTIADWDKSRFFVLRARAVLKGLIELGNAEPANVHAEAKDLLNNVDTLFQGESTYNAMVKTVALMKLHRKALSGLS